LGSHLVSFRGIQTAIKQEELGKGMLEDKSAARSSPPILVTVLRIQPHKPKNNSDVPLFFSASTSLFNGYWRSSPTIKYLSIAPLLNALLTIG